MYAGAQAQGVAEGVVLPFREGMALAGVSLLRELGDAAFTFEK